MDLKYPPSAMNVPVQQTTGTPATVASAPASSPPASSSSYSLPASAGLTPIQETTTTSTTTTTRVVSSTPRATSIATATPPLAPSASPARAWTASAPVPPSLTVANSSNSAPPRVIAVTATSSGVGASRTSHKLNALTALLSKFDSEFLIVERNPNTGSVVRSYYPDWALPVVGKLKAQIERLLQKAARRAGQQPGGSSGSGGARGAGAEQQKERGGDDDDADDAEADKDAALAAAAVAAAASEAHYPPNGGDGDGDGDAEEMFPVNPKPEFAPKAEWTINLSDDLPFVHRNRSKRVPARRTPFQPPNTIASNSTITVTTNRSPPRHPTTSGGAATTGTAAFRPPVVRLASTNSSAGAASPHRHSHDSHSHAGHSHSSHAHTQQPPASPTPGGRMNAIASPPSSLAVATTSVNSSANFTSTASRGPAAATYGARAASVVGAVSHSSTGAQSKAQKTATMRAVAEQFGTHVRRSGTGRLMLSTDHIKLGDTFRRCGYNEEMWRLWLEEQMKRMRLLNDGERRALATPPPAPPPPPPPLSPKRVSMVDPNVQRQIEELQRKIFELEAERNANRGRGSGEEGKYFGLLEQLYRLTEAQKAAADRMAKLMEEQERLREQAKKPAPTASTGFEASERDELLQKLAALREQLEKERGAYEAIRKKLESLQAGFDALLNEKNALALQVSELTKQVEQTKYEMMVRLTNQSMNGRAAEGELAACQKRLATLQSELRDARAHNNSLQQLLSDEKRRSEEWKVRLARMERELRAAQELAEQRRRERDALAWSLEQKTGRGIIRFRNAATRVLQAIIEKRYYAMKNDRQFQRELNGLSRRLRSQQLEQLTKSSRDELAAAKLAHEREIADLLQRLKRRDEIITELKNRLEAESRLAEQFGKRVQALEAENEIQKSEIDALRHQLREATADTIDVQFSKHMISSFKGDYLAVTENKFMVRAILEQGDTEIYFSDYVEKISSWNQRQKRILVITEKALYTFDASTFDLKRRIRIGAIDSVHLSKDASDMLVVHVTGEHDHLYCAPKRPEIMYHLLRLYQIVSPNHDKLLCAFGERMMVDDRGNWRRDVLIPQSQTVSFGTRSIFETQKAFAGK